jgi:hypothetical protein
MKRLKQFLTAAIFVALLFPTSTIHAQEPATPPVAAAEAPKPDAPAATDAAPGAPVAPATTESGEAAPVDSGATTGEGDSAASTEPEATAGDLLAGVAKTVNDWKTLGWLAGLIALLNLLMGLLRFKPIDVWMKQREIKWVKPWIAMGLGAVVMGLSTYQTDANVLNSIVAGLLAGLGSTGAHEAITGKLSFGPPKKAEG